jgi:hypothetical protein
MPLKHNSPFVPKNDFNLVKVYTPAKQEVALAVAAYLLVAIMKRSLQGDDSLYTILQILSVSLFEKKPILCALEPASYTNLEGMLANQLELFES